MHDADYVSPATMMVLEHLQSMYDDFTQHPGCSYAYILFIEQSHEYVASVKSSCDEHEHHLIQDVQYDLLHEAFIKHFKNTQNS
jgi:hypothetical protein